MPPVTDSSAFLDQHLEFVQQVISRLNGNSFQLKGWNVTLAAALFALAAQDANYWFAALALVPVFFFWFLDAYYLTEERFYRKLYDHLRTHPDNPYPDSKQILSMDPGEFGCKREDIKEVAQRPTVLYFHGALVIAVVVVVALIIISRLFGRDAGGNISL